MSTPRVLLCGLVAVALSVPAAGGAQSGWGDTTAAPRCEMKLDLMAVVYNDRRPERSFAMVASGRNPGRMVGTGSWVAGRPVIAVLPRALWLGPEKQLCWIPLAHEGKQRVSKRSKRNKRNKRNKRKRSRRKKR